MKDSRLTTMARRGHFSRRNPRADPKDRDMRHQTLDLADSIEQRVVCIQMEVSKLSHGWDSSQIRKTTSGQRSSQSGDEDGGTSPPLGAQTEPQVRTAQDRQKLWLTR